MIDLGDVAEAILDIGSPVVEAAYRRWGCAGAILALLFALIGIGLLIWWIVR